jgi:hypothetical protein
MWVKGRFNVVDTFLDLDKSFHESQMYINKEWHQSLRKPIILSDFLIRTHAKIQADIFPTATIFSKTA